jgi:hypothetical protein
MEYTALISRLSHRLERLTIDLLADHFDRVAAPEFCVHEARFPLPADIQEDEKLLLHAGFRVASHTVAFEPPHQCLESRQSEPTLTIHLLWVG